MFEEIIYYLVIAGLFVFLVVILLIACKGSSTPSSARVEVSKPRHGDVDGISASRAYDASYSPGMQGVGKGGLPVTLRTEREKTDTWKLAEGVHKERTESEQDE